MHGQGKPSTFERLRSGKLPCNRKQRRELERRLNSRWQLLFNGAKGGTSVYDLCSFRSQKGNSGRHESSDQRRRLSGLSGLVGALLFFAGDMLFYGHFGPGAGFADGMLATVIRASPGRLFAGGLVGPFAACMCIIGFWHVYLNVRPSGVFVGRLMLVAFSVLMVAGSAVHTLWTAKGLALKYCYGAGAPCSELLAAMKSYWALAYNLGAIPGYIGAVLLIALIVLGRTWYPRWTVITNPAVLLAFSPLADQVPSPLGAILVGGFTNLSIAVFFLVSVLTTWKREDSA